MDITASLLNGAVLALFTAILAWLGKLRFDSLERRMDRMDERIDRIEDRLDQLVTEIAHIRSDLLQVALAAQPRPSAG